MSAVKKYFKEKFEPRMFLLNNDKAADFYLSCWQVNKSTKPLLIVRSVLFIIALAITLFSMIMYIKYGIFGFWFIYLTHWGLTLISLVTGFATAVSAVAYFTGPIQLGASIILPWYIKTYWVLYNATMPLAFLITLFYWTLLYEAGVDQETSHLLDLCIHAFNSVLMFILLFTSNIPSRLAHFYYPYLIGIPYILFGVIYHQAGGKDQNGNAYIYPVVDWSNLSTTILVVAITGVLLLIIHLVIVAIAALRDKLSYIILERNYENRKIEEGVPLRQQHLIV